MRWLWHLCAAGAGNRIGDIPAQSLGAHFDRLARRFLVEAVRSDPGTIIRILLTIVDPYLDTALGKDWWTPRHSLKYRSEPHVFLGELTSAKSDDCQNAIFS